MQQALNNSHYQKIWEKVIINRHPLCERKSDTSQAIMLSLADALKQEMYIDGCYYYVGENLNMVSISIPTAKSIRYDKENGLRGLKILGRSITLEDILILCKGYFAGINIDVHGIFKFNAIGTPEDWSIIAWKFTKPLDEQTPETWEKIANLID